MQEGGPLVTKVRASNSVLALKGRANAGVELSLPLPCCLQTLDSDVLLWTGVYGNSIAVLTNREVGNNGLLPKISCK